MKKQNLSNFTPGTVARLFLDGASIQDLAEMYHSTVREIEGLIRAVMIRQARRKHKCPCCGSTNTTRFQWVDNEYFEYWMCRDCRGPSFVVELEQDKET